MFFSVRQRSNTTNDPLQVIDGNYDFIIIGGGTAGCALASRLSEDQTINILVIEAGGSARTLMESRMPLGFPNLFRTEHDWNLNSQPQAGVLDRSIYLPRGKLLGGCSSINAQIASYGDPSDYDEIANIIGDDMWKWANFKKYFKQVERYQPNPEHLDVDIGKKGTDGPVVVGFNTWADPIHRVFIQTCKNMGIPYNPDFNASGSTVGVNRFMTFVDETRVRSSSETGYLTSDVLRRPNIKVLTGAVCTKVLTRGEGQDLIAIGVEFQSQDGNILKVSAKREVILAAGAIHSPHILLLSGIGPDSEITSHGLPVVLDLPGVGKNLKEHATVAVGAPYRTAKFINSVGFWDTLRAKLALLNYLVFGRGVYSSNIVDAGCFVRSNDKALFPKDSYTDDWSDTKAKDSPDIEIFSTFLGFTHADKVLLPMHSFGMQVVLLHPKSKGSIKLASADPLEAPILDYNFFSDREDLIKLVRGLRLMIQITQVEPLRSLVDTEDPHPDLDHNLVSKTDEELEEVVKKHLETVFHPVGTCKMAPLDQGGVVDSQLRVYGVGRLRVCDVSILPETVAGHTAGPALAIGEYLADVIRKGLKQEHVV